MFYKNLLQQMRIARGWTQAYVAEQLNTNQFTIARWESGRVVPRPYFRQRLCKLFQVEPDMFGWTPQDNTLSFSSSENPVSASLAILTGRDSFFESVQSISFIAYMTTLIRLSDIEKTVLTKKLINKPLLYENFPDTVLWFGLGPDSNIRNLLDHCALKPGIAREAIIRRCTNGEPFIHASHLYTSKMIYVTLNPLLTDQNGLVIPF